MHVRVFVCIRLKSDRFASGVNDEKHSSVLFCGFRGGQDNRQ